MRPSGWGGFALALVALFAASSMVFDVQIILWMPSLVIVVGWSFAVAMMTFGVERLLSGLKALTVLFSASGRPDRAADIQVLRSLRRNLYAGGVLGVLFGVVAVLSELSDPSMSGPGLATTLVSLIYATVLAELLCRPAIELMEEMVDTVEPTSGHDGADAAEPDQSVCCPPPSSSNSSENSG